tara:strand:- start:78 stop:938 length:861 start_codon:yes stop_codon:yes gene_type:complete
MDIYLLNEIQKLENATPSASGSGFFLSNNATTGETVWPIITSTNNRGNVDNMAWNTSSPHATFYAYFNSEFDSEHAAYMAIQNGNHQSNNMSNHEGDSMPKARFGKGNWVGVAGVYGTPYKTQSYPPLRTSLMFVKNPTSSSVNMTVNFGGSSYYNSGYDGAAFAIHLPNSLNKGNVTSTNYYKTSYQSNTQNFMISMTQGLPAGRTATIVGCNSMYYHQDSSSWGSWQDLHYYYNLDQMYSAGLRPDLDMYRTVLFGHNFNSRNHSANSRIKDFYVSCDYYFPST